MDTISDKLSLTVAVRTLPGNTIIGIPNRSTGMLFVCVDGVRKAEDGITDPNTLLGVDSGAAAYVMTIDTLCRFAANFILYESVKELKQMRRASWNVSCMACGRSLRQHQ